MTPDFFPASGGIRVWYCRNRRCRQVLKTDPPHALTYGCKCKVPQLPSGPTILSWASTPPPYPPCRGDAS